MLKSFNKLNLFLAFLLITLALTGCLSKDDNSSSSSVTPTPQQSPAVEITGNLPQQQSAAPFSSNYMITYKENYELCALNADTLQEIPNTQITITDNTYKAIVPVGTTPVPVMITIRYKNTKNITYSTVVGTLPTIDELKEKSLLKVKIKNVDINEETSALTSIIKTKNIKLPVVPVETEVSDINNEIKNMTTELVNPTDIDEIKNAITAVNKVLNAATINENHKLEILKKMGYSLDKIINAFVEALQVANEIITQAINKNFITINGIKVEQNFATSEVNTLVNNITPAYITEIVSIQPIIVKLNTDISKIKLPTEVDVKLSNNKVTKRKVKWMELSKYNKNKAGEYIIKGIVSGTDLLASIKIIVDEEVKQKVLVAIELAKTSDEVEINTEYVFPNVYAKYDDGSKIDVTRNVRWYYGQSQVPEKLITTMTGKFTYVVKYTENNVIKETTFVLNVKAKNNNDNNNNNPNTSQLLPAGTYKKITVEPRNPNELLYDEVKNEITVYLNDKPVKYSLNNETKLTKVITTLKNTDEFTLNDNNSITNITLRVNDNYTIDIEVDSITIATAILGSKTLTLDTNAKVKSLILDAKVAKIIINGQLKEIKANKGNRIDYLVINNDLAEFEIDEKVIVNYDVTLNENRTINDFKWNNITNFTIHGTINNCTLKFTDNGYGKIYIESTGNLKTGSGGIYGGLDYQTKIINISKDGKINAKFINEKASSYQHKRSAKNITVQQSQDNKDVIVTGTATDKVMVFGSTELDNNNKSFKAIVVN